MVLLKLSFPCMAELSCYPLPSSCFDITQTVIRSVQSLWSIIQICWLLPAILLFLPMISLDSRDPYCHLKAGNSWLQRQLASVLQMCKNAHTQTGTFLTCRSMFSFSHLSKLYHSNIYMTLTDIVILNWIVWHFVKCVCSPFLVKVDRSQICLFHLKLEPTASQLSLA